MEEHKVIFNKSQKFKIILISVFFGLLGSLFISAIFFTTMTVFASFSDGIDLLLSLYFGIRRYVCGIHARMLRSSFHRNSSLPRCRRSCNIFSTVSKSISGNRHIIKHHRDIFNAEKYRHTWVIYWRRYA